MFLSWFNNSYRVWRYGVPLPSRRGIFETCRVEASGDRDRVESAGGLGSRIYGFGFLMGNGNSRGVSQNDPLRS